MLLAGSTVLVGALGGSQDRLRPLGFLGRGAGNEAQAGPAFERVGTLTELERIVVSSAMPVMLDVYADWCAACKEMKRWTFSDPAVIARLGGFRLLQADVTGNDVADRELLHRLGLDGAPGVAFFAPGGQELTSHRAQTVPVASAIAVRTASQGIQRVVI
jgi:thiol:disulfide interchange protein DsbD